jgi:transcriptional regulator with XRE-family HTH domain
MVKEQFGRMIQRLRRENAWTIQELVDKLGPVGENKQTLSPGYITKIEVYGEIPQTAIVCKLAEVFKAKEETFLTVAKESKIEAFSTRLEEKIQDELVLYRKLKGKRNVSK